MDDIQTPLMSSSLVSHDSLKNKALDLLQEDNMLIAKERLILGEYIGKGHFGLVYKAEVWNINKQATENVAVKTLQTSGEITDCFCVRRITVLCVSSIFPIRA